jgi:hypothetical protein
VIGKLAGVSLPQSFLDLRNQAQPLDRVVDGGVVRERLQRLDGPLLDRFARDVVI